ncbi:hypothetical protein [Ruegeria sp. HKCCD8929]|uniref:hypothetical protein n=1 Tax=Ruegeria sp. HKCCD8929 TaxID=2683006 RepID=UPI0014885D72|nr:hypothetical protein [Ruegeria sp. HKCCD8929]
MKLTIAQFQCTNVRLRNSRKGIVLVPVIVAAILITGVVTLVQSRSMARVTVLGHLSAELHRQIESDAVHALLAPVVSRAFVESVDTRSASIRLDGTPITFEFGQHKWHVSLQDVEGLVDIYLADPRVLQAAGLDAVQVDVFRRSLPEGKRFATVEQTFAHLDMTAGAAEFVTQSALSGRINLETVPSGLAGWAKQLPRNLILFSQPTTVRVGVRPGTGIEAQNF